MSKTLQAILDKIPHDSFSDTELIPLFPGSPDRRYGLIKRAIADQELIHLRRGLYLLSEKTRRHPLNLFSLAQKIYGPSYISMESALSYHGWIPESVPTIISVSSKRSRNFDTPVGRFEFRHVSSDPLLAGVRNINEGGTFFLATPWKAIADTVFTYKKNWEGLHPLIHSLRIEEEFLKEVSSQELQEIEAAYQNKRVSIFLKNIRKELRL